MRKRPEKPYKDFPLSVGSNGQWVKNINGKRYHFGVWEDPDGALEFYNQVRDDLYAGRTPTLVNDGLRLRSLVNLFLDAKEAAARSGEIKETTYKEYRRVGELLVTILGDMTVSALNASDFATLREKMSEQTESAVTLKNQITKIKVLFRWAADNGKIERAVPLASTFKPPTASQLRKAKASSGSKLWTASEIKLLIKHATGYMVPAIYLAINGGMGNTDVCKFKWSNIQDGYVDFPRPKSGVGRRFKLWPETIVALNAWKDQSKEFASEYVCCSPLTDCLGVTNTPIAHEFEDIADAAEIVRNGRGFYGLRHTYRTIADQSKDQPGVMYTMGHADHSISAVYRQKIEDKRLAAIATIVRKWLSP